MHFLLLLLLVWPVPLAQVWTHYKIGKLNMWRLFCNVWIYFLKSCLNRMVSLQLLPWSQLIFPSKTWFFGIYWSFQQQKSLWIQCLPRSESKSWQMNSIKSCSSRSFNNTKATSQILWNFQLWFNLIFSEEIVQYSRTFAPQVQASWNQAHGPLLIKSFPKTPRTWSSEASWFGGSHIDNTKQNKTNYLPS